MKRFALGLVVGKFSPLHKGHELTIQTAFAQCDSVRIISYAKPGFSGCEPAVRRAWLKRSFPHARVLVLDETTLAQVENAPEWPPDDADDLSHRRFVGFLCHELLGERVDAVFTSEDYGPGFAAELQSYYRERVALNLGADVAREICITHVAVDPARVRVPISGTRVRLDPHSARGYLSPHVYARFIERIVLLGGESSGKSTLARALAERLGTCCVEEYGRTLWEAKAGNLQESDLLYIAQRQIEMEDQAAERAHRRLICDTSPLTTRLYSEWMFGRVDPQLVALAKRRYSLTVLCAPDIPFHQDGTRRDAAFRVMQHQRYLDEFAASATPYLLVHGSVEERVEAIARELENRGHTGFDLHPKK